MNTYFEIQNLLAFVSAVFGGFAIALAVGLLQIENNKKILPWATALSVFSAIILILSTVTGTFGAIWIADRPYLSELSESPEAVLTSYRWSGISFMFGILLLLSSIGLSGFLRSKIIGWLTTLGAIIINILIFYYLGSVVEII